jgi:endoglucanase
LSRVAAADTGQNGAAGPPLQRGVNLGGWFSHVRASAGPGHAASFFRQEHLDVLAAQGFDHVRLGVDERVLDPARHRQLRSGIAMVRAAGLTCVLDLHAAGYHRLPQAERYLDRLRGDALWRAPAPARLLLESWRRLLEPLDDPAGIVLDVLNEPSTPDAARWHDAAGTCAEELTREYGGWCILEAARGADVRCIPALPPLPATIYGFHLYAPLLFTHQLAPWGAAGLFANRRQGYPGRLTPGLRSRLAPRSIREELAGAWDAARLRELVRPAVRWARAHGVRLHCGEFGVYLGAPRADRYRWLEDVLAMFDGDGVGWAYWNLKNMGFGIWYGERPFRALPEYRRGVDFRLLRLLSRCG